jgi:hypothetical protein
MLKFINALSSSAFLSFDQFLGANVLARGGSGQDVRKCMTYGRAGGPDWKFLYLRS